MKNVFNFLFTIVQFFYQVNAQDVFIKHYGNFSGQGNSVISDSDGNYLLTGVRYYTSNTQNQFFIQKIDQYGNTIWLKHYGGALDDEANKIISTNDGGYALIGTSINNDSSSYITLIKLNSLGDYLWTKTYGGYRKDLGISIIQTKSGDYFIGANTVDDANYKSNFFLIKTNSNGDTLWTRKYGGSQDARLNEMTKNSYGEIVMTGYLESGVTGFLNFYLLNVDSNGIVQWSKTYGDSALNIANSVKQTPDKGYILTGYSNNGLSSTSIYVVKTDSVGDTLWTHTFASQSYALVSNDVLVTKDGGYAIAGTANLLQFTPPNITTILRGDVYLIKLLNNGFVSDTKGYPIELSNQCVTSGYGNCIIQLPDESCVIGGTFFNCSSFETLLIRTFDIGPLAISEHEKSGLKIFPIPSNDKTTFQFKSTYNKCFLRLFDLTGRAVFEMKDFAKDELTIEKADLTTGIYFYNIVVDEEQIYSGKIIFY